MGIPNATVAQQLRVAPVGNAENKTEHSEKERAWHDLSAADVGAFIGAAMLMGVHPQSNLHNYWSDSDDKPIYPLEKYISRQRFQQISRFLKVNNPHEDEGDEFWHKVEPLSSLFREACQRLLILGDTFSIDENLIAALTRSGHLMEVKNKAAGKGYKIYSLALQHYLFDWIYTSKNTRSRPRRITFHRVKAMKMMPLLTQNERC